MSAQPKKPQAAYFIFINAKREEIIKELGCKDVGKVGKRAGELWKNMADAEKQPYEAKAKAAKEQYDKEMEEFLKGGGVVEKRKKRSGGDKPKKVKDDNAPKRPPSGYAIFVSEKREEIFKELASRDVTKVGKRSGEMWKALSDAEKEPYEAKAKAAKAEYDRALEEYRKSDQYAASLSAKAEAKAAKDSPNQRRRGRASKSTTRDENNDVADGAKGTAPVSGKVAQTPPKRVKRGPPAKSGTPDKVVQPSTKRGRKESAEPSGVEIDEATLKAAGQLADALRNLASRPEAKGKPADVLLKTLQANGGLVNKAKAALATI